MRSTKRFFLPVLGLFAATALPGALAAEKADLRAIDYRQAVLTVVGANFSPLVAMAREQRPYDREEVIMRAERINTMAQMMEEAFRRDTSSVDDVETEALDKIWSNWDDFTSRIQKLDQTSMALAQGPSDFGAFKAAFSDVGGSCKGCHDNYRED